MRNLINNTVLGLFVIGVAYAQIEYPSNDGFGVGQHSYADGEEGVDTDMTVLTKGAVTYRYTRTGVSTAVLKREQSEQPTEVLLTVGAGEVIPIRELTNTFLVDVKGNNDKIIVLFLLQQSYYYLEIVENYANGNPPAGDAYVPDSPEFLALDWKPLKYGQFTPAGFVMTNFQGDISTIDSIELKNNDVIELAINGESNPTSYQILGGKIMLGGVVHQSLDFERKPVLESEFFAGYDAMTDAELEELVEPFITPAGELDHEMATLLNSLVDTVKSQALKARVEALFD